MKEEVIIGSKFNRLTVIEDLGSRKFYNRYVKAICECGITKDYRYAHLKTGRIQSCGCLKKESQLKHGKTDTRYYRIHHGMKQRCYNKNTAEYKNYGRRGITVCDEWLGENGFINFYNWSIKNGYRDDLSIDRIDNDKGYSPDNCRWADGYLQSSNKRKSKYNKSGYTGVWYDKSKKRYASRVSYKGKKFFIGRYKTKKEALENLNFFITENKMQDYCKLQEYVG